jgi:hypothetical protein
LKFIRWSFIIGFGFAALYNLFFAFIPKVGDIATGQRHLLFVLINIIATILMASKAPRALLLLVPLILQLFYSHGSILWEEWESYQQINWISLVLILTMALLSIYVAKVQPSRNTLH